MPVAILNAVVRVSFAYTSRSLHRKLHKTHKTFEVIHTKLPTTTRSAQTFQVLHSFGSTMLCSYNKYKHTHVYRMTFEFEFEGVARYCKMNVYPYMSYVVLLDAFTDLHHLRRLLLYGNDTSFLICICVHKTNICRCRSRL